MIVKNEELFRNYLRAELLTRTKNNPRYSLRAFAKTLQVEPSSLSQLIAGKRPLTKKMCLRLSSRLGLSPQEYDRLISGTIEGSKVYDGFKDLAEDEFLVISDWYHYAILELTTLEHFKADPKWIAKVLGISYQEVIDAASRLVRLGHLEISDKGVWTDTLGNANNLGNHFTAPAFRKLQKQILEKAVDALEEVPYPERIQSSLTLPVPKAKIAEAKKRVQQFMAELDQYLKQDEPTDDVYHMSFSLYPISNTNGGKR